MLGEWINGYEMHYNFYITFEAKGGAHNNYFMM